THVVVFGRRPLVESGSHRRHTNRNRIHRSTLVYPSTPKQATGAVSGTRASGARKRIHGTCALAGRTTNWNARTRKTVAHTFARQPARCRRRAVRREFARVVTRWA